MAIDSDDNDDDETTNEVPHMVSGYRAGPGRGKSLMGSVKNVVRLMMGSRLKVPNRTT